mgnify:CR=1 FL=1
MAEWQKGTGWKEWFEITGADGVDFHPIGQDPRKNPTIVLQSNTKEDILERKVGYPKSSYSFWKKINGKKYYISLDNPTEVWSLKMTLLKRWKPSMALLIVWIGAACSLMTS